MSTSHQFCYDFLVLSAAQRKLLCCIKHFLQVLSEKKIPLAKIPAGSVHILDILQVSPSLCALLVLLTLLCPMILGHKSKNQTDLNDQISSK